MNMIKRIFILASLILFSSSLWGQRVFHTIDITEVDEDFQFDVNQVPVDELVREVASIGRTNPGSQVDLNISPNVVFSPDSEKAFVAVPSSDRVLVFSPRTGEVVANLVVGDNPTVITLTPDGTQVGVVSAFLSSNLPSPGGPFDGDQIGAISMIDVATLEVRTLNLSEVFFSIANNIVFSEDSSTGFVASSRTDEIIRFDVESLTETSRLEMVPGSRPSQITMAPDFQFFGVVLVGSTNLPRLEVPDSVALVDTATFQVAGSLVPVTGQGETEEILHDFVLANRVAFSEDGRFAVIADQQFSELGLIPELSQDRAFLFDVDSEQMLRVFTTGGVASGSYPLPDGRLVVMTALEVVIIDPVEESSQRINPPVSEFRPSTRPAFQGDRLFVASPLRDRVNVVDLGDPILVTRTFPVGGDVVRDPVVFSGAPLDLGFSPDGTVMTVVNFNENTIDLVLQTERVFQPTMVATDEFFVGTALTNCSGQEVEVEITGRTPGGLLFLDDPDTEEEAEVVNPRLISLPDGAQFAATARELILAEGDFELRGWFDFDAEMELPGFFLFGDRQLQRLDGGLISSEVARVFVVPEVRISDGMMTELTLLNPFFTPVLVTVDLINNQGELVETVVRTLGANQSLSNFLRDPDPDNDEVSGIFADSSFEGWEGGYVLVSSSSGIQVFERYFDDQRMAALNAIPVSGDSQELTLVVPQVALFEGSDTTLSLVNRAEEEVTALISLRANDGSELVPPAEIQLAAEGALQVPVDELFFLEPGGSVSGWLLIEADKPGLVGSVELQLFAGKAMTTLVAQAQGSSEILFSHVAEGVGLSTGLALLNAGESDTMVSIEVFTSSGELVRSGVFLLGSRIRDARLLSEFFPDFPELIGGYIKVRSDQPIIALELFFADNLELVSAVPAQSIQ